MFLTMRIFYWAIYVYNIDWLSAEYPSNDEQRLYNWGYNIKSVYWLVDRRDIHRLDHIIYHCIMNVPTYWFYLFSLTRSVNLICIYMKWMTLKKSKPPHIGTMKLIFIRSQNITNRQYSTKNTSKTYWRSTIKYNICMQYMHS